MLVGLDQAELSTVVVKFSPEEIILLPATSKHRLYRLKCKNGSYILKWCNSPNHCIEPKIYSLLRLLGVPTLPTYEHTDRAIVLEDLQSSTEWRLAEPSDMGLTATGKALAEWYCHLHHAGREALKDSTLAPDGLGSWISEITAPTLKKAGAVFNFDQAPVWGMAIRQAETLKAKYLALPQTFNY
jgi:hypothetical protein